MEYGVRSGRTLPHTYLKVNPKLEGDDKLKIELMNDLHDMLIRMVALYPYSVAEDVYHTVFDHAIKVPYTKVKSDKDVERLRTQFMDEARAKLTESEANFMRMHKEAEVSAAHRAEIKSKLKANNSPKSHKSPKSPKSPKSVCPESCVMMGGRSYKYRNMRKSRRNMRKSHRKSRK